MQAEYARGSPELEAFGDPEPFVLPVVPTCATLAPEGLPPPKRAGAGMLRMTRDPVHRRSASVAGRDGGSVRRSGSDPRSSMRGCSANPAGASAGGTALEGPRHRHKELVVIAPVGVPRR